MLNEQDLKLNLIKSQLKIYIIIVYVSVILLCFISF